MNKPTSHLLFAISLSFLVCISPYTLRSEVGVIVEPTFFYAKGKRNPSNGLYQPLPILNKEEQATGLILAHGTKVRVSLLNDKNEVYIHGLGQKPQKSMLLYFEEFSPTTEELEIPIKSGFIYASQISQLPPKITKPLPPEKKRKKRHISYTPIDPNDLSGELHADIQFIIKEFHNSLCSDYQEEDPDKRRALINGWKRLINELPKEHQEMGKMAMHVDMVARTVLYEAHPSGSLSFRHKNQGVCEWDTLTLSIRNRASTCKPSYFYCSFKGDYTGVATAPSQYLIWKPHNIKKTHISSCFLKESSKKDMSTTNTFQIQMYASNSTDVSYQSRKRDFKKLIQRVPIILGFHKSQKDRLSGEYLTNLFQVTSINNEVLTENNPSQQLKYLKKYHHYFHPNGLRRCVVDKYPYSQYMKTAYISMDQGSFIDFGLLINKSILVKNPDNEGDWEFSIKDTQHGKVRYLPSESYFRGQPRVSEQLFTHKTNYSCLPNGQMPACYTEEEVHSTRGRTVPTSWFNNLIKEDIRHFLVETRGLDLPKGWEEREPGGGSPIGLKCLSADLEVNQELPEFHGMCDKNIKVMINVK